MTMKDSLTNLAIGFGLFGTFASSTALIGVLIRDLTLVKPYAGDLKRQVLPPLDKT